MRHIKIGITHGDINSTNYEIVMKVLSDQKVFEGKTFIVYGSPKVAAYHRKNTDLQNFNFNLISNADEAANKRPNIINCVSEEIRVDAGSATNEAGMATIDAMQAAVNDLKNNKIDILITMPINKESVHAAGFDFTSNTNFLAKEFGSTQQLEILVNSSIKACFVSNNSYISQISKSITKDAILEKIVAFNDALRSDFGKDKPKIAVLTLNSVLGEEEKEQIIPAIEEAKNNGFICVGPYFPEAFFANAEYSKFDGVLAMYRDQIAVPFKAISYEDAISYTSGLPKICVAPSMIVDYASVDKNKADGNPLLQAIFAACDILDSRESFIEITKNQLK